ncbi:hypothetical protein Tco_1070171 [Tanacetum coccineum]|uniref:Uncharacterized protein n=1 Tax=Tanacetum coccineum TaxID=301880 RepID=A0ABQ5HM09_9ASTR
MTPLEIKKNRHLLERKKVNEELRNVRWWEIVRRRPTAATKDHMIYHMLFSSYKVYPHGFEGYSNQTWANDKAIFAPPALLLTVLCGLFKDGGGVKEFQRSFRHSDTERLSRSDEVLKLKNFKKDATLKFFKTTIQERYEHVGSEITNPQDGKVSRWQRDCAWLMISRCSRSQCQIQVQGTSSIQKSMITTTYSQENVKRTS